MNNKINHKVFLFSTIQAQFIENDRQLLLRLADVSSTYDSGISAIIKLLYKPILSDTSIAWFASTYSAIMVFISRIFNKTSIVIIGGSDVFKDRQLNYGLLISKWKIIFVKYTLNKADYIFATSNFLIDQSLDLIENKRENICVLYPGLDPAYWKPNKKKKSTILTVAHCPNEDRFYIKGIDILFEAACALTEVSFTVIGIDSKIIKNLNIEVPPNIILLKYISNHELLKYYQCAAVYCQPSRIESLSLTVGEAMMCGCIPVVSNTGGMPEIVKNSGYIIPSDNSEALSNAITKALMSNSNNSRETAMQIFSLSKREQVLREILS